MQAHLDSASAGVRKLGDQAYLRLRDLITSGALRERSLIRESDLVRQLGVSRTPVREALRRAEAEGLLRSVPHGGYELVELSESEMADVYRIRALLEAYAARMAAESRSRAALGEMADLVEAMDAAHDASNHDGLTALNRQFHDAVARASNNKYLVRLLLEVREIYERYRPDALGAPGRRGQAHHEHHRLVDAIAARDGDLAAQIAHDHAITGLNALLGSRSDGR